LFVTPTWPLSIIKDCINDDNEVVTKITLKEYENKGYGKTRLLELLRDYQNANK
jgi:hypothetical protein